MERINVVTEQNPDTVTPLDGDGRNVVKTGDMVSGKVTSTRPTEEAVLNKGEEAAEVAPEKGDRVIVATPRGYAFDSNDSDAPLVSHVGAKVTQEMADALIKESVGLVFIRNEDKEEVN